MTTLTQRQPLAHLGTLLRFSLRYNRLRLVIWLVLTVGMVGFIGSYYLSLDPAALNDLAAAANIDSMKALLGWVSNTAPLGGKVWIKSWMFIALMLGVGMVFLVTHNLRADEDNGRTELFRSRPLGLHSSLMSTLVMTVGLCVVVGVGIGLVGVAMKFGIPTGTTASTDPDPLGSWVFGWSIAAVGLLGVGVAVLTNELMPSSSAANGVGAGLFGVFYIIRLAGDIKAEAATWVSPLGWAEKMDPWGANRFWPLVLVIVLSAVLVLVGWLIEARRDYGGSLFAARLGHPDAKPAMTSVWGLAVHQQRVAFGAWAGGVVVFSALLGSVTTMMSDMMQQAGFALTSTAGFMLAFMGLAVAAFSVQSAATMALDDSHGLLERQLAGGISRLGWALQRLAVTIVGSVLLLVISGVVFALAYGAGLGDYSDFGRLFATVFAYIPSLLILVGITVLGLGWWPRVTVAVSWTCFGACWFIFLLGVILHLPDKVLNKLPFMSVSALPDVTIPWATIIVTLVVGVVLVGIGLAGFRRRNIPA